jgi:hypothetical protein
MPQTFPYTNGSDKNNTIKSYTVNSFTGIRGKQSSEAGMEDVVYLQNQNGGYASLILTPSKDQIKSEDIFTTVLSSFKFIE